MIGKVKLLSNYKEISDFHKAVEEHGVEELFMLGKYDKQPVEKFVSSEFLFKLQDVDAAWVVGEKSELINIKMNDGEIWTLHYDDQLWNKLKEFFKE